MEISKKDTTKGSSTEPIAQDDIFVIRPEPKKPIDKKTIWTTVALSILGIAILATVLVVALIGSATGLADNYRSLALTQIKKLNVPLKDLEPSKVFNNRNTEQALGKINTSKQAQPALENILLVGGWSEKYTTTNKLQSEVKEHYLRLGQYSTGLGRALVFDDTTTQIAQKEPNLVAIAHAGDSLSLRSVGGNYQDFAGEITALDIPVELNKLRRNLASTYSKRADIYIQWAVDVEAGNGATATIALQKLQSLQDQAISLSTDKNYIKLLRQPYKKLLKTQKTLESALAN